MTSTCTNFLNNGFLRELRSKFVNTLSGRWPGLCVDACTNLVATGRCDAQKIHVSVTLTKLGDKITKKDNSITLSPDEIIKITAIEGNDLSDEKFTNIGQSVLQKDLVVVVLKASCDEVVGTNNCVACGPGSFFNSSLGMCALCPVGTYSDMSSQTSCKSCGEKTTLRPGARTPASCVDKCPAGQYFRGSSCSPCPRDYYQEKEGQSFCYPCPLLKRTKVEGTDNATKCFDGCPSGTELQDDGSCKDCAQGYFRTRNLQDNCKKCPTGRTTEGNKTTTSSGCNLPECPPGRYINASNICTTCPIGTYQPRQLKRVCINCEGNYTTEDEGSTNATDCKFFCPDGYEQRTSGNKTCTVCPRGSYHSSTEEPFSICKNCTDGLTTDRVGSEHETNCSIEVCTAGQNLTSTLSACADCPEDTYQPETLPSSTTQCRPCPSQHGTKQPKTNSTSDCLPFCAAGHQVNGTQCEPCPRGTWNDGSSQMRFLPCEACSDGNYTTPTTGANSSSQCKLRNCSPGYKIVSGSNCEACGFGQFQPLPAKNSCEDCGPNLNTSRIASTSQKDCTISCGPGEEGLDETCSPCSVDTFKDQDGFGQCMQCLGSVTSDSNRISCNVMFCDRGVGYDEAAKTCTACPKGHYKDTRGNTACMACPKNYTTAGTNTTDEAGCDELNCEPGFFAHKTDTCTPCPNGYYKATVGTENCTMCDADKTTAAEASTSQSACSLMVCPAGEYRSAANTCQKCAVGEYQPNSGQTQCTKCDGGNTTLSVGSNTTTDCLEPCEAGTYLNVTSRSCIPCPLGTFLPNHTGTTQMCRQCPSGWTTRNVGATQEADCDLVDCQPGYYRKENQGCQACGKGFYQPAEGQTTCIKCGDGKTTFLSVTNATTIAQCIEYCPGGEGYNVLTKACEPCPIGKTRNTSVSDFCYFCPPGQTTATAGSEICLDFKGTTPPTVRVTVSVNMTFTVEDCGHTDLIHETIRLQITVLIRTRDNEFPDLCQDSSCGNIAIIIVDPCGGTRRKRQTKEKVIAQVTASNLPEKVPNTDNTVSRSPESVLVQALADNSAVTPTLTAAGITFDLLTPPTVSCGSGFVRNLGNCEACPAGTRHDTSTDTCQDCDIGQYQDETGKTSCKVCLGTRSTTMTKSTNVSDCVSKCKLDEGYCENRGTCRDNTDGTVSCDCTEYYTGDTCSVRRSLESDLPWVIIGVCIGVFVLLVSILGIGCLWHRRSRGSARNDKHAIVDQSSNYHDYMRSPFAAPQGYIQYLNPEYNEVYDFYNADERHVDQ